MTTTLEALRDMVAAAEEMGWDVTNPDALDAGRAALTQPMEGKTMMTRFEVFTETERYSIADALSLAASDLGMQQLDISDAERTVLDRLQEEIEQAQMIAVEMADKAKRRGVT